MCQESGYIQNVRPNNEHDVPYTYLSMTQWDSTVTYKASFDYFDRFMTITPDPTLNDGECKQEDVELYMINAFYIRCSYCAPTMAPTELWDGSWYISYIDDSADLVGNVLTSSYLTKPGVEVSTDVTVTCNTY